MTHNTDKVGFPNVPIRQGMVLKLEAQSPTTDANVAGVSATRWSIYGTTDTGATVDDVVPLYTATDVEGEG